MKISYILEYKLVDSKGRQKNSKHVGVFGSLETLEQKKQESMNLVGQNLSFQIYTNQSWI